MATPLEVVQYLRDGLTNLVSNIGTDADKHSATTYFYYHPPQSEIDAAYRMTWLRKIVDIPADDAVREWRAWQADENQIRLLEETEARLNIRAAICEVMKRARKDGGAALLIGVGKNLSTELRPESVGENGLDFVHVLSRFQITVGERDLNPLSPRFSLPKDFQIRTDLGQQTIHPSRIVPFIGAPILDENVWDGWGDSIWTQIKAAVMSVDTASAVGTSMLHEAQRDIIRVPGLMEQVGTADYEERFLRRFQLVKRLQSNQNITVLDKDDEWETKTVSLSGIGEIQDRSFITLSGISDIPATRLFGKSPDGMNATGDSDLRNYYDRVRAHQDIDLRSRLNILDEVLIRSALGSRPEEVHYVWKPLYTIDEAEGAVIEKTMAEAVTSLLTSGVLPPTAAAKAVQNRMIESGRWPGLEKGLAEAEAEGDLPPIGDPDLIEAEREAKLKGFELAANPPDPDDPDNPGGGAPSDDDDEIEDSTPAPLYVSRRLVNVAEFREWAEAQGITKLSDNFHVTIAYSRAPVDWVAMGQEMWGGNDKGELILAPGGPRIVERLGDDRSLVLLFASHELSWRHEGMIERGASWDFDGYQPHVTISYDPNDDLDLDAVEPYRGKLVFGPEIFEALATTNDSVDDENPALSIMTDAAIFADQLNPGQPRTKGGQWSGYSRAGIAFEGNTGAQATAPTGAATAITSAAEGKARVAALKAELAAATAKTKELAATEKAAKPAKPANEAKAAAQKKDIEEQTASIKAAMSKDDPDAFTSAVNSLSSKPVAVQREVVRQVLGYVPANATKAQIAGQLQMGYRNEFIVRQNQRVYSNPNILGGGNVTKVQSATATVASHKTELENTLGNATRFEAAVQRVAVLPTPQVKQISKEFTMLSSTSKAQALQRIRARQQDLEDNRRRLAASAGRSAA